MAAARPTALTVVMCVCGQPAKLDKFWTALQDLYLRLYTTRLAAVAAIEGHSPAGGCLLAMCCDYRIMTSGKPMIGLNETQLGIVAPTWFRDTFVNTIGHRQAEKMLGLGLQVDATKAKAIGLVDEAVPLEEVFPRAQASIEKWLAIPGTCWCIRCDGLRDWNGCSTH
jgi:3,2-trans-enoyl-CoA isomerase